MDKRSPKTVKALRSRTEEQLLQMKGLSLEENHLETKKEPDSQECCDENEKIFEMQEDVSEKTNNNTDSVDNTVNKFEEEFANEISVKDDWKTLNVQIAHLRRQNAKRKNKLNVMDISPAPKRPFISDPVPPNSPVEGSPVFDFSGFNSSIAIEKFKFTAENSTFAFESALGQGSLFSSSNAGTSEFEK